MYTFTQKAPHHLRWFALISVKVTCQESLITRLNMIPLISVNPVTQMGCSFGLQLVTWRCEHVMKKQKEVKETQRRRRLDHTHTFTSCHSACFIFTLQQSMPMFLHLVPAVTHPVISGGVLSASDWHCQSSGIINILELQHSWYPLGFCCCCCCFFRAE